MKEEFDVYNWNRKRRLNEIKDWPNEDFQEGSAEKIVLNLLQDESYQGNNDEGEELAEMIVDALKKSGFLNK